MAWDWGEFVAGGIQGYTTSREKKEAKKKAEREEGRRWYENMLQQDRTRATSLYELMAKAQKMGGSQGADYLGSMLPMLGADPSQYQGAMQAMRGQEQAQRNAVSQLLQQYDINVNPDVSAAYGNAPEALTKLLSQLETIRAKRTKGQYRQLSGGQTLYDVMAEQPLYTAPKQYAPQRRRSKTKPVQRALPAPLVEPQATAPLVEKTVPPIPAPAYNTGPQQQAIKRLFKAGRITEAAAMKLLRELETGATR